MIRTGHLPSRAFVVARDTSMALLLVLMLPGLADAQTTTVNFAEGRGKISDTTFQFEAIGSDPATDAATGSVFFTNPGGSVKGSISCLRVAGGAGYFVVTAEESSDPNIPVGGMFGINVYDSDQPNGVGDKVLGGPPAASGACQDPSGIGDPIDSGDIVVGTMPISGGGSGTPQAPHTGHHKRHHTGHHHMHHGGPPHHKHKGGGSVEIG